MAKKAKQPLGLVTIQRGESDDKAREIGLATWSFTADGVTAIVTRPSDLADTQHRYTITAGSGSRTTTLCMTADDFAAVVAAARALMERVR